MLKLLGLVVILLALYAALFLVVALVVWLAKLRKPKKPRLHHHAHSGPVSRTHWRN